MPHGAQSAWGSNARHGAENAHHKMVYCNGTQSVTFVMHGCGHFDEGYLSLPVA
jgi:hypothetical protein